MSEYWEVYTYKWRASFYDKEKAMDYAKKLVTDNPNCVVVIHKVLGRMWLNKDNTLSGDGSVPDLLNTDKGDNNE